MATSVPDHLPGFEPDNIQRHLNTFFTEIDRQFPDKIIVWSEWNHERLDKAAGFLSNVLGYTRGRDFLEAYGYTIVRSRDEIPTSSELIPAEDEEQEEYSSPAVEKRYHKTAAMKYCPDCGHQVSVKAEFCPNCGCPLYEEEKPEFAVFTLQREKKAFFMAVVYDVYLDYQLWGNLRNGERLSSSIVCGLHHLKLIDRNNFNKVAYENDFTLEEDGLTFSFSAAWNVTMNVISRIGPTTQLRSQKTNNIPTPVVPVMTSNDVVFPASPGKKCPRCGGPMIIQTVSEARKSGCGTILLYLILALTIFGLLIVIPLMLRRKTETVTYAVCQNCGYKRRL